MIFEYTKTTRKVWTPYSIGPFFLLIGAACLTSSSRAGEKEANTVSIVFAGDVMVDGDPGHDIQCGRDPFAEFGPIFHGADLAVCNLESVLGRGGDQVLKPYTFRGARESIPLLKKYFSAVSVANNHTGDFGKVGFCNHLDLLAKEGLPAVGGGRNIQEARRPRLFKRNGMTVALLAYNNYPPRSFAAGEHTPGCAWLVDKDVLEDIRLARRHDHADVVIPFVHWGVQIAAAPLQSQRDMARRMIDAGASAVIGGHPHVTQTVEIYHGKPIVYSLGNFVFDYFPGDPPVWTGWVVRLIFDRQNRADMEMFGFEIGAAGTPHLLPAPDEQKK